MTRANIVCDAPWIIDDPLPPPVARAFDDLARDWTRLFGTSPNVSSEFAGSGVAFAFGQSAITRLTGAQTAFSAEEYQIILRPGIGAAAEHQVVCVDGGGIRGLIYAIYGVSEHILGVDPFWFWTDQNLRHTARLNLPAHFELHCTAPIFRWRGWFIDDADLLAAWAPSRQASHGISLDAWDALFETLLRVGGNLVVPGAFLFPDEPQLALAAARGLAVGQHHGAPLGLSEQRWPDEIPASWQHDPQLLADAWRESIAAFGDCEVVWTVGLRGRPGCPFQFDSSSPDEKSRGALMSAALAKQVELVRQVRPDDDIVLDLWMEGVELAEAGHLVIPETVTRMWTDDGHGRLPAQGLGPGQGIDYHVTLTSEVGSSLNEMVHPALIEAELRRAIAAGATTCLLLNISDVRNPTSQLAMQLAWTGQEDLSELWLAWAKRYAGSHGEEFKGLWERYFQALWEFREGLPERPQEMGYHRLARWILRAGAETSLDGDFPVFRPGLHYSLSHPSKGHRTWRSFIERAARAAESTQQWLGALAADTEAFLERIEPEYRGFIHEHLLTHVALHVEGNRMLAAVARAVLLGETPAAKAELLAAREHGQIGLQTLRRGAENRWPDWYRGEQYVRARDTLAMIDLHLDRLKERSSAVSGETKGNRYGIVTPS